MTQPHPANPPPPHTQKKTQLPTVEGEVESGVEPPHAGRQGEGQTGDAGEALASEGHQGLWVAGDAHHLHQVGIGQEVEAGELRAVAFQVLLHVFQNLLLEGGGSGYSHWL